MPSKTVSKTSEFASLSRRLDEIYMSENERLRAKASLARAEALADTVLAGINLVNRLLKTLVVRPFRRLTAPFG